jgi:threonine aldolase
MNLNFASDNTGPVHPRIWAAMGEANAGAAMPYGGDPWMPRVTEALRDLFAWPEAEVLLVATGTGANALALSCLVLPWQSILCHEAAHIEMDEGGAPELLTGGAKLALLPGDHGRIGVEALERALAPRGPSVHSVRPGALSLTNVTEAGTVYGLDALDALTGRARERGLACHLDGARFANACAALDCDAAEMARGFDIVSFGGTKNGCMAVEAVVMRDPARHWEMQLRRKRAAQLWSKHRFLSAQMAAYLEGGLWLETARAANAAAARLARGLHGIGAEMAHPSEANMIFFRLPRAAHDRALAEAQYYLMDDAERPLARLVCDPTKTGDEIDRLVALLAG